MRTIRTYSGHGGPVYELIPDKDPGQFLSGSGDGTVVRWSFKDPDRGERLVSVDQAIFSLFLLPGPNHLLIGTESGDLHLVDLDRRAELQLFQLHRKGIFRMVGLNDGIIACAGGDGHLSLWRIDAPDRPLDLIRNIPITEAKIRDCALSQDGGSLALACGDGTIRILETKHFNEIHTMDHPDPAGSDELRGYSTVMYHPSKPVLLSGGKDGHLRAWTTDDGFQQILSVPAHKGAIYRMAIDHSSLRFATVSRDKSAKVWDLATLEVVERLDRAMGGHSHSVNALLWLQDGLLSAGDDRKIIGWQ